MRRKTLYSLVLAAQAVLMLGACDSEHEPPLTTTGTDVQDRSTGDVSLSLHLGPVGVLARSLQMTPNRLVLQFNSGATIVRDTIQVAGSGTVSKNYKLPSQQNWNLLAIGLDQRDSVLYIGSSSFTILANKTTAVSMSLNAKYSSLQVRFPIIDSLTRFVLTVDGSVWGDSSVVKQARVGDTIKMDHDYLTASPSGVAHAFGLRIYGQPWGVDTLSYSLDTSVSVVSGNSLGHVFKVHWVGAKTPPPGFADLTVFLGSIGKVDVQVVYEDTTMVPADDHGIPWNRSVSYGRILDSRDGKTYRTVRIGAQTWMAENLNWAGSGVCYANSPDSCAKYGRLYTWPQVMDSSSSSLASPSGVKGICPTGWHVPSDAEWQSLEGAIGMSASNVAATRYRGTTEGTKLKSTLGWDNLNGTDAYGFRVLPAGYRVPDGTFIYAGYTGNIWTASENRSSYPWYRYFNHNHTTVLRDSDLDGSFGFSLRCIAD